MKKRIERTMALAAVAGQTPATALGPLLMRGLQQFRGARVHNQAAIKDASGSKGFRDAVRVGLPYGAKLYLPVIQVTKGPGQHPVVLAQVENKLGRGVIFYDTRGLADDLIIRIGKRPEAAVKVLLGIERARLRCWHIAEEENRFLHVDSEGD